MTVGALRTHLAVHDDRRRRINDPRRRINDRRRYEKRAWANHHSWAVDGARAEDRAWPHDHGGGTEYRAGANDHPRATAVPAAAAKTRHWVGGGGRKRVGRRTQDAQFFWIVAGVVWLVVSRFLGVVHRDYLSVGNATLPRIRSVRWLFALRKNNTGKHSKNNSL